MHIGRRLVASGFDRLHDTVVFVHYDTMPVTPTHHLSALVKAKVRFVLVVTYLGSVGYTRAGSAKA